MFKFKSANAASIFIVLVLASLPIVANAASMFCRSDPIVYLSDGTRLQFDSEIATNRENVQSVHYQLHVPTGVSIERIIFTPHWARAIETVELVPDQADGNYRIAAFVNTVHQAVEVRVNAMFVTRNNGGQGSSQQTVFGLSGQAMTLIFNR